MENTNTPEISVREEEKKTVRKGELALSLVVLALLVVLGFIYLNNKKSIPPINTTTATTTKTVIDPATIPPKKTDLGTTLPQGFLPTIPLEKNTPLTQSYIKEYNDRTLQQSIAFRSAKTMEDNYAIYEQFFKREGWSITPGSKTGRILSITGTKGSDSVDILIVINKATSTLANVKSNVIINLIRTK